MNRATLLTHRAQWSQETAPHVGDLPNLKAEESSLYDDLRFDRFGPGIRFEQERVPFNHAYAAICGVGA